MPRCAICRAEIAPGSGVLLKAGRRTLGVAHPDCTQTVQRGVALAGKLALMGALQILEVRAPKAMLALTTVRRLVQQQQQQPMAQQPFKGTQR